jgi:O-antigen/teichoic acid export membrane protein
MVGPARRVHRAQAGGRIGADAVTTPAPTADIDTGGRSLRAHTARGTLINSAFQIGLAGLGLLRRVIIAAFLTRSEFGIWGIIVTALMTLFWLKELGIADKYVQQTEADQEAAFQKAFTLELAVSVVFFVLVAAALPIFAAAYHHWEIIVPGIVLALSVPASALESPVWIPYRRMQFVRQRLLLSVDTVVAFVVTVALGVAGAGYWCLVIGTLAGAVAGGLAALASCPYRIRLRFDRGTLREYASFSWPLVGLGVSNLVGIQSVLLVANHSVGIAGLGSIGLAASISQFADRVDDIVSTTVYPAVCRVRDRVELMFEAFVTSNRLAVMWGLAVGAGLALFAGDLVHYVLGDRWKPGVGLLAAFCVIAGVRQIGFNWAVFMRAVGDTRPMFVAALTNLLVIAVATIPLTLAFGLTGYALGMGVAVIVQVAQRGYFLRRLFPDHRPMPYLVRAILPSVPPAALVLGVRALAGGDRTPARVIAEVVLYVVVTFAAIWLFERTLIRELVGYLRGDRRLRVA